MQLRDRPVLHASHHARLGVAVALVLTGLSFVALSGRVSLPSLLEQGWQSLRPATVPARIARPRPAPPRPLRHPAVVAIAGLPRLSLPAVTAVVPQPEAPRATGRPQERASVATTTVVRAPAPTPVPPAPRPAPTPTPAPAAPAVPPGADSPTQSTTTTTAVMPLPVTTAPAVVPVVVPSITTPVATTPAVSVPLVEVPPLP